MIICKWKCHIISFSQIELVISTIKTKNLKTILIYLHKIAFGWCIKHLDSVLTIIIILSVAATICLKQEVKIMTKMQCNNYNNLH